MNVSDVLSQSVTKKGQRTPQNQLGEDAFLQILSSQMKYQDPLSGGGNPTESISQLAQFSSLEQMQNLNSAFSKMLQYQNAQYGSQLIGKSVTLNTGEQIIEGTVDRVKMSDGEVRIMIEDIPYKLEQVVEIKNMDRQEVESNIEEV